MAICVFLFIIGVIIRWIRNQINSRNEFFINKKLRIVNEIKLTVFFYFWSNELRKREGANA